MKKILFLNFACNWCPHYETELELMLDSMNKGHEVYSLSCDKMLHKFCIMNHDHDGEFCNECQYAYKKGLKVINFPKKNILKLSKVTPPEFPIFKDQKELGEYSVDDINIGCGVLTSVMSLTRDYMIDIAKNKKEIEGYLKAAYTVVKNMQQILKDLQPDAVYIFNGRFLEYWPVVETCKKFNIDYYLHERGSDETKYHLIKNDSFFCLKRARMEINFYWNKAKEPERSEIAKKWYTDRKNGVTSGWISFTKNQKKNSLPDGFDPSRNNIAMFNSSLDEYYAFSDWRNPIADNENEIIKSILERYKDDSSKHFYLRIHPNLKNIQTTQIEELKAIENTNYSNFTIIWPHESIDTYSLIESADKIISFASTVGVEATFLNKPSISAGINIYGHLNCCYIAENYPKLFELIDAKLEPKNAETAYPYAYYMTTVGEKFNVFKPDGLFNGSFLGKNIRKKSFRYKLIREIKYPIKKLAKKIASSH